MDSQQTLNLAIEHFQAGRLAQALELYRRAVGMEPNSPTNFNHLGNALSSIGSYAEAIAAFTRAVDLDPKYAGAWYNLGIALDKSGRHEEAIAAYQKSLEIEPDDFFAVNNLANAMQSAGRIEEAESTYRSAVALRPDFAWTHWNLGICLLARGRFEEGWSEFEWRLKVNESGHPCPDFQQPRWDGRALEGKRILLWTEQGYGDMIQFARFVRPVLERGGKPVVICPPEMIQLFQSVGNVEVLDRNRPLPPFEVECPLMSLPLVLKTNSATIPADVPYLRADADLAGQWGKRLGGDSRKKIGLVWSGRALPDPRRSVPSPELAPLGQLQGVRFISLQRGENNRPPPAPPADLQVTDWTSELRDFADTAALIENLDAVISIDTAVAHLAGAMGKKVFLLLPHVPDWRWRLQEEKCPWYPTMQLFRQPTRENWRDPMERICRTLAEMPGIRFVARPVGASTSAGFSDLFNSGVSLASSGQMEAAIEAFQSALAQRPGEAATLSNLSYSLCKAGRFQEAADAALKAIQNRPDFVDGLINLGQALMELGRHAEAAKQFETAVQLRPDSSDAHANLANAYIRLQRPQDALTAAKKAVELNPNSSRAQYDLGLAWINLSYGGEAEIALKRAIELDPQPDTFYHLGVAMAIQHDYSAAARTWLRALELDPRHRAAGAARIFHLYYELDSTPQTILAEHRLWNRLHVAPCAVKWKAHPNPPDPERQLRIGLISGDFRDHVAGRNMRPIFEHRDRQNFHVVCYSNVERPDAETKSFREVTDEWRDIRGMSDDRAAALVRQDRIDILVDLSMHMADNRLMVMARKPAPVQATFIGYPGTTGVSAIDWRLSDPCLDPPGEHDADSVERTWRLPNCYWCYEPAAMKVDPDQPPAPLPAERNGFITFGCFNKFGKVNPAVLSLWGRTLEKVPHSRMRIMAPPNQARRRVLDAFAKIGIGADRIDFLDYQPPAKYLAEFDSIDVGLDTFPYNGHTASLDALWCGVPVVTRIGNTVVGRAGLSQLSNLKLAELAARSDEDFIRIAYELAADLPRLAELRRTLRQRMLTSPLTDGKSFTHEVEAALRGIWRDWCAGRNPVAKEPDAKIDEMLQVAVNRHKTGNLPGAEAMYRQIIAQKPDHADALNLLGVLCTQTGRGAEAVELLRRAVAIRPHGFSYHLNLGVALVERNELGEAIEALTHALAIRPGDPKALCNLANAFWKAGQYVDAIAAGRAALEKNPNYFEAHNNLGNALQAVGKLSEAIEHLAIATKLQPKSAEARANLASALFSAGRVEEALAAANQAVQINPNSATAQAVLQRLQSQTAKASKQ